MTLSVKRMSFSAVNIETCIFLISRKDNLCAEKCVCKLDCFVVYFALQWRTKEKSHFETKIKPYKVLLNSPGFNLSWLLPSIFSISVSLSPSVSRACA